jgi:mannosidase alpha-like ER degradation enhancer 2
MIRICVALAVLIAVPIAVPAAEFVPVDGAQAAQFAQRVKAETRHAWREYMRYAAGHDELSPLARKPRDWYAHTLLMTPVDALDTLLLMGLDTEANQARELIVTRLSFDHDMYVKNFEITIRLLGGLLSGYELTHDKRLLQLADDLATRLLPAFGSKTGLPYEEVNLATGAVRGTLTNPAETGTLLLEFGTLAKLTGKELYYDKAKRAVVETYKRRSPIGLVGSSINVESGLWTNTDSHISGGIDSYYEYLYKCWKLFGDPDCKQMWDESIVAADKYLADEVRGGELWFGHADMRSGARTASEYGALDAFFPALLALSGDLDRAQRLQDSSLRMWRLNHIEPESLDYREMRVKSAAYALRPEIVESTYYLDHYTHDPKYRAMGRELFEDFTRYCRTDSGYAELEDVRTKEKRDSMQSWVFAETLKYYYLLFAPKGTLDFDSVVFNTEAHPLRRDMVANDRSR